MHCTNFFLVAVADWLKMSTSNMAMFTFEVVTSVVIFIWFLLCTAYTEAKEKFDPHVTKVTDPFDVKPGGSEHTYSETWVRIFQVLCRLKHAYIDG